MTRVESRLLSKLAEHCRARHVRRTIRWLQTLDRRSMMSPEDSGLSNAWDEVCVQVQSGESIFWDLYLQVMHEAIEHDLDELPRVEREVMWLQTPGGEEWLDTVAEAEDRGEFIHDIPAGSAEIAEWVVDGVLQAASGWSNPRIRRFRDHEAMID